jgi:hypothetical protein
MTKTHIHNMTKTPAPKTLDALTERMILRLRETNWRVILRSDFAGMASYDQIGRRIGKMIEQGLIVRIGHGIYAKATIGPLTGKTVPLGDIKSLAKEAMQRLGVEVGQTHWEKLYSEKKTDQIPLGRLIAVKTRVKRKISWGDRHVKFEVQHRQ